MSKILPHSDLDTLHNRLIEEIPPGSSVLDIGAGLAKYHQLLVDRGCSLTLVDAHKPYLDERATRFPKAEIVWSDVTTAATFWDWRVLDRSWDVALCIDFLEHLDLGPACEVVEDLRACSRKVILFVPEGNHPQDTDHYGMGADHWQTHRSVWYDKGLEDLGFTVERWVDFHRWNPRSDPGALWATWRKL